jgi:hypothetical protein
MGCATWSSGAHFPKRHDRSSVDAPCSEGLAGKGFPKLDVFLESPGGSPDHAFRVATLIHEHAQEVFGVVPHYAKSACTLIALGMNELILGELGELGPLDTQRYVKSDRDEPKSQSSLEVVHAMRESQKAAMNLWHLCAKLLINTADLTVAGAYELAATFVGKIADTHYSKIQLDQFGESVRALDIGKKYAMCVLERYADFNEREAEVIANRFVEGYPSHNYAIDLPELKLIGLKARGPEGNEGTLLDQAQVFLDVISRSGQTPWENEAIELIMPEPSPVIEEPAAEVEVMRHGEKASAGLVQPSDPSRRSGRRKLRDPDNTAGVLETDSTAVPVAANGGIR